MEKLGIGTNLFERRGFFDSLGDSLKGLVIDLGH
jgi:hypothetical protein